jgi:hypothetical protein
LPTLAYRLEHREVDKDHRDGRMIIGSYVVWEDGVVDISASAALAAASGGSKSNSQDHTAKADCTEFLKTVLADGWVEVANITVEAISAGPARRGKAAQRQQAYAGRQGGAQGRDASRRVRQGRLLVLGPPWHPVGAP